METMDDKVTDTKPKASKKKVKEKEDVVMDGDDVVELRDDEPKVAPKKEEAPKAEEKQPEKANLPILKLAFKLEDLTRYTGDVAVYELKPAFLKGTTKISVVVAGIPKGISGKRSFTVWEANKDGKIVSSRPIFEKQVVSKEEGFELFGYAMG